MTRRIALTLAIWLALASNSGGVLIDSGDGTGNTRPPTPDPGWSNIGVGNGLTVIYLGEGWVLSAAHVGEITVAIDGGVYPPLVGSRVVLRHARGGESDLELFRIAPYPSGLPSIQIRRTPVAVGDFTLMVGNGRERGPALSSQPPGAIDGYAWSDRKNMRWGTNIVTAGGIDGVAFGKTTHSFYTKFDRAGTTHEGQATVGDSGGPVFTRDGPGWELAGIIWGTHEFQAQPRETVIYGNLTVVADLAHYRAQILEIMSPACGNGYVTIDEQCDDANTLGGDCCSANCRFEADGARCTDGLRCTGGDRCDGAGVCSPGPNDPCDDRDVCTRDRCNEQSGCENVFVPGPSCRP